MGGWGITNHCDGQFERNTVRDPLTIAIDYDETFTADTSAWTQVIQLLQSFGHRVICVSARQETANQRRELEAALPKDVNVLLSYCTQKKEYVETLGFHVDIWIDDCPEGIVKKSDVVLMFDSKPKTTERCDRCGGAGPQALYGDLWLCVECVEE